VETLSWEPDRVVFGVGAESAVAGLLQELGARRVLLIAQARHTAGAERIAQAFGAAWTSLFTTEVPQVPSEVADAAIARARAAGVDWVLAHGGGTPIGVAKAVALELPVSIAAVPTTYAGSERTNIWGIARDGRKLTGRDDRVRPRLVVYDPELTLPLDRALSIDSLFNALAHSVEALYAEDATTTARMAAANSIEPLISGLVAIANAPRDLAGRSLALRGAWLASTSLGGASMGLHHKLAHVLGGRLGAPHARAHAVLLPYTLAFNAPSAPAAMTVIGRALGSDDPPGFLYDLRRQRALPTSLGTFGLTASALPSIADEALQTRYPNPRPVDRASLLALLEDALLDRRPSRPHGADS
jgi:maleylacetate reductase